MTLHAQTEFSIPEETIRIARAVYPRGNTLMQIRDAASNHLSGSGV